jgi:hypothetical protein
MPDLLLLPLLWRTTASFTTASSHCDLTDSTPSHLNIEVQTQFNPSNALGLYFFAPYWQGSSELPFAGSIDQGTR